MAVTKRGGTGKFGWCMDGHCEQCPAILTNGRECACPHHKKRKSK